jgi:hypothetical protein
MNQIDNVLTLKHENLAYKRMIQIANEEGICRRIDCWVVDIHYGEEILIEYAWYVRANTYHYIVIYKDLTVFHDGYDTNIIDGYHYVDGKKYRIEDNYIGSMSSTRFISSIQGSALYEFRECAEIDTINTQPNTYELVSQDLHTI